MRAQVPVPVGLRAERPGATMQVLRVAWPTPCPAYALGDLIERFVERCARPGGLHHHRPECECRIFVAAEAEIGHDARKRDRDHAVHDEGTMCERPFGKIELHHRGELSDYGDTLVLCQVCHLDERP